MWVQKIFVFLLILIKNIHAANDTIGKCCDFGEVLQEFDNSTYKCVNDKIKRNSILISEVNIMNNITTGICLEYSTNFYKFEFSDYKIINKSLINDKIFPKCCPVGFLYNPMTHSCVPKNNFEHNFITENLIKVGLPQCHIIDDTLLTGLENLNIPEEEYCDDETQTGYVRRKCTEDMNVCNDKKCVKKCCPDGKSFLVNSAKCVDTYENGLNLNFSQSIENPTDEFAIIVNKTKCDRMFFIMPEARYKWKLDKNGNFYYSDIVESPTDPIGYCIEHSQHPKYKGFFFFNCLRGKIKAKFQYTMWPKILSCVFLALTILFYVLLQQTRKLFGKILINYCLATFLMFALLVYVQFDLKPNDVPCQVVGFGLVFLSTVSFAWLNVMCVDIWLTFGSTKHSVGVYQTRSDLKKLLKYSIYGWGMPLLLTILIYILSIIKSVPESIRPYVGTVTCFIAIRPGNYALLAFFRVPLLVIQILNSFLFIKTIVYCMRIKNEIHRINDNKNEKRAKFNKDKEKLFLILKLAVIMGISFIVDTATALIDMDKLGSFWRNFEIVIDCFNCLQGVWIFIIFICKRSVYLDFLKKVHIRRRDTYFSDTTESFTSSTRVNLKPNANGK